MTWPIHACDNIIYTYHRVTFETYRTRDVVMTTARVNGGRVLGPKNYSAACCMKKTDGGIADNICPPLGPDD